MALPIRSADDVLEALQYHLYGMEYYWQPYAPAGPAVFPTAALDELDRGLGRMLTLLRAAAATLGGGWPRRHAALGLEPQLAELYGDPGFDDHYATAMARPDVIRTADGWQVIEFNVGSALGAQSYVHVLGRAWAELYGEKVASFRTASDPLRARGPLLTRLAGERGVTGPVAVLGYAVDLHQPTTRYYDVEVQQANAAGFEAEYLEAAEFTARPEHYGRRFPLGIQRFVTEDWFAAGRDIRPLAVARNSGCWLLAPQSARILNNKRLMAILSAGGDWLSADDAALVDRYLPWTREVAPVRVRFDADEWFLPDLLLGHPECFVLKPAVGNAGRGVTVGHETPAATWRTAVEAALAAGTWIVQRYVRAERIDFRLVDAAARSVLTKQLPAVVSPYMIDGRLAGGMVRFDLANRDTVLHVARDGVRLTSLVGL